MTLVSSVDEDLRGEPSAPLAWYEDPFSVGRELHDSVHSLAVISGEAHWDLVRVPSKLERLESVDSGQLAEA